MSRSERTPTTAVRIEPAASIPDFGSVRHYDELPEQAQDVLPALANGVPGEAILDEPTAQTFVDGEYVKFTGYYRVRVDD